MILLWKKNIGHEFIIKYIGYDFIIKRKALEIILS